jgi:hypothetical protein
MNKIAQGLHGTCRIPPVGLSRLSLYAEIRFTCVIGGLRVLIESCTPAGAPIYALRKPQSVLQSQLDSTVESEGGQQTKSTWQTFNFNSKGE